MPIIFKLHEQLSRNEMTVRELGQLLDLHPSSVSRLKNGKVKSITAETLDRMCEIFGCQPEDLLEHVKNDGERMGSDRV